MRAPRVRFTVRWMMIAVAVVALSLWAILWVKEMRTRSAAYQRRALEFGNMTARSGSGFFTSDGRWFGAGDDENTWLHDTWACKLSEKYWRLSDYPWLPVEPDRPPPKPLAHPRRGIHFSAWTESGCWNRRSRSPAWTFIWTWPRWN